MSEAVLPRRGRKIVTVEPGGSGKAVVRCPGLNCDYPAVLLPSREGVRYALTAECRLYTFDWSWADFFDSGSSKPHTGDSVELTNVTLGELGRWLPGWAANLDALFGPGASAAVAILGADGRLGMRELHATLAGGDAAAKRNRAQALVTFPLLAGEIVLKGTERRRAVAITRLIDQGEPLMRELPMLFECRPWMIRRLRGLLERDIAPFRSASDLVTSMAWLTPERAPRETGQYTLLSFFSNRLRQLPDQPDGWIAYSIQRSILKSGWPAFGTRVQQVDDILDYGRFVARLSEGLVSHSKDVSHAIDSALGHPEFHQVARLSERWHEIEGRIRLDAAVSADIPVAGVWRPLFEEDLIIDGHRLRCLRTRQELLDEGTALNHCVASYADLCQAGQAHIVRITRDGEPVATAELQLAGRRGGPRKVVVRQVRGHRNARTVPEAMRVVEGLVKLLEAKDLSDFTEAIDRSAHREGNAVTWLFEQALKARGIAGIEAYRECLLPSRVHTRLWDHVIARCRKGHLAKAFSLTSQRA